MTEKQIDLEEAIAAAEKAEAAFVAPLNRKAPPKAVTREEIAQQWEDEYGPSLKPKTPRALSAEREERRERMIALSEEVERFIAEAKDKTSPLFKELQVRAGQRLVGGLVRKVKALADVALPEPYQGAPTRQREAQAGEEPQKLVAYTETTATGIKHRWVWPVHRAWQKHKLRSHHVIALNRFRQMFDATRNPSTIQYGERGAPSDPAKRNALTAQDNERQEAGKPLATTEFDYVRKRLEPEFFLVIWVLVLERALPNADCALSPVSFGRQYLDATTDQGARDACDQALKWLGVRLCTIYKVLDNEAWYRSTPKEVRSAHALHTLQQTA